MTELALEQLARLPGTWTTEATHPSLPGVIVHGTVVVEWLEGKRFLIHRACTDHPDFPDSISIIGITGLDRVNTARSDRPTDATEPGLRMHYYDSRGVSRVFDMSIDDGRWRIWRDAPGFSQRFTGTFADDGNAIDGLWELRDDDGHWKNDLEITYRRSK
jgi:hypothetical protein